MGHDRVCHNLVQRSNITLQYHVLAVVLVEDVVVQLVVSVFVINLCVVEVSVSEPVKMEVAVRVVRVVDHSSWKWNLDL